MIFTELSIDSRALFLENSDLIVHSYGIVNGLFLASFIYIMLLGFTLLQQNKNTSAGLSFFIAGLAYAFFGLSNLYLQSVFSSFASQVYTPGLIEFSRFSLPLALILTVIIFVRSSAQESFFSYLKIKDYKPAIWFLYSINVITLLLLVLINPIYTLPLLSTLLLPHALILGHFYYTREPMLGTLLIAIGTAALPFLWMLLSFAYVFTDINLPQWLIMMLSVFAAVAVIVVSFVTLLTGHELAIKYFEVYELDTKNLVGSIFPAINSNQFYMLYQPKLCLSTGQIMGLEALIRWQHPRHGNISPIDFIRLAEKTGSIDALCRWTIDAIISQAKVMMDTGYDVVTSINFSALNVNHSIIDYLQDALHQNKVPASRIMVEITESLVVDMKDEQKSALERLYALGVRVSLDDYGTGFSSLSYINKLQLSEIKIDRSFVFDLDTNQNNFVIVESTLQMAKSLGLCAVAEGVECAKISSILNDMGCDVIQGYFVCKPLSVDRLMNWLYANRYYIGSISDGQSSETLPRIKQHSDFILNGFKQPA